jgi:hypothetical protein
VSAAGAGVQHRRGSGRCRGSPRPRSAASRGGASKTASDAPLAIALAAAAAIRASNSSLGVVVGQAMAVLGSRVRGTSRRGRVDAWRGE